MFCNNCGNKLEDGAKFCNNCGAPQEVAPQAAAPQYNAQPQAVPDTQPNAQPDPQPTAPQYQNTVPYNPNANLQPPVQAKKTSTGCIVAIIVAIVLGLALIVGIGTMAIIFYGASQQAPTSISNDISFADDSEVSDSSDLDADVVTGLTYEEVFSSNYIVEAPALFRTAETCSFAYAETDGYVEKSEYGYEDDVIMEMVDTYYFPLGDYTQEEADAYATLMKSDFSAEESLDFCTVTYSTTNNYFIATVKYTDVDDKENLKEMQNVGLLDEGDFDYLSMEETEKNYLEIGFVKK